MSISKASIEGVKLTPNFYYKEFVEGSALPSKAIKMNYDLTPTYLLPRLGVIAERLQTIRNEAKAHFGKRLKGIEITCGVRVKDWELFKGRSGKSQHVQLWAADFRPICEEEDFEEIFNWIFDRYKDNWIGGWAINRKLKFIHADCRPDKARWEY